MDDALAALDPADERESEWVPAVEALLSRVRGREDDNVRWEYVALLDADQLSDLQRARLDHAEGSLTRAAAAARRRGSRGRLGIRSLSWLLLLLLLLLLI